MDIKKLTKTARENIYFIAAVIIVGAAIGWQSAKFFPSGYQSSQLFFIAGASFPASQNYPAAYFSQENARNFTDTAVAILQSPEFINGILPQGPSITIVKIAPQVVKITANSPNPGNLDQAITQVAKGFNQKIQDLSQNNLSSSLQAVAPPSQEAFFALNSKTLAAAGAVLGALFVLLVISLKVYFEI
jgi:capsular polysaccharide biosynthesis protein